MALPPTRDELAAELKVFIPKVGRWRHESSCGICGVGFSYVRGRHHCRYCGTSVCGKHSRTRAVVPSSMSTEKQRVCDVCYPKCQYGIPLQRQRGLTTSGGSSRGVNFTLLDVVDSNDPRLVKTERGRARTIFPGTRGRSGSGSHSPLRKGDGDVWDPKQRWNHHDEVSMSPTRRNSANRRRGISEPPERNPKSKKPTAKAPPSPPPYMASMSPRKGNPHDVFPASPKKHQYHSPQKFKSAKTLSIRKRFGSSPPPPLQKKPFDIPPHHALDASFATSEFASSYASARDTTEQDDIAKQYLASFIKAETQTTTMEQNHVTVSHDNSGAMLAMPTVVEMKPASPQELQLTTGTTPPVSETAGALKSQNRKMSSSSTGTVSVSSDSEQLEREKPLVSTNCDATNNTSDDEDVPRASHRDGNISSAISLTAEVNNFCNSTESEPIAKATSPANEAKAPLALSVGFLDEDNKSCEPEISEEGAQLMHEIMELEKQIHQHQLELPALIEEWKRAEHAASLLREDARQSRDKVHQYQKAHAAVGRAIRVATKWLQEGEYEAAVLELSRAAAIERTNAKVWYMLGESRFKLGQLTEAEKACRVSVELQHSAVGVTLLGRILHALGRHDEAIQCYLTALGR